jgi:thiol peroxidase
LLSAHSKVWSDYKYHDFGKKTNLIINEWQLLARSILVLDNDNLVVYVQIANPLESEPDYKALINFLETWNKH